MSNKTLYKTSANTPLKQQSLEFLLWQHMDIVKTIWFKYEFMRKDRPYRYFDLHGGYGRDKAGNAGSPLIFHKIAQLHNIPYTAIVFEKDKAAFDSLSEHTKGFKDFHLSNDDHRVLINEYSKPQSDDVVKLRKFQFGIAYSDPSNADPSFDVLRAIANAYPMIDIIINLAAASYKRTRHLDNYTGLRDELLSIKDTWIIRKPIDTHQWTMLLGTQWKGGTFKNWEQQRFAKFDGDLGREWFDKIAYTQDEIRDQRQLPLLPSLFAVEQTIEYSKKKVNTVPTKNI